MHIGQPIHDKITQLMWGDSNLSGTTFMDKYVKCGMHAQVEKVLKGLPERNIVS